VEKRKIIRKKRIKEIKNDKGIMRKKDTFILWKGKKENEK